MGSTIDYCGDPEIPEPATTGGLGLRAGAATGELLGEVGGQ
ncbi:hypothetical protein [Rhodococcus qingshengii]|nr:hypothetical protein [Rhodococcus qingshengii]MCQ4152405.1 hypothetical protein [Rhodococcus qingshengii]